MKALKKIIFYLIFLFSLVSCNVLVRYMKYGSEDTDDYQIFPKYEFKENSRKYTFETRSNSQLDSLESLLEKTSTRSFIVIKNDSILFEKYFRNYKRDDISTVFSVSKSVTSLLVGIAIDEGYIKSTDEPVTNYLKKSLEVQIHLLAD